MSTPLDNYAPPFATDNSANTPPMASPIDSARHEDSVSHVDADTPVPEDGDSTPAPGRKRKLNSVSARGVANLTPEQLAKKRANDRQAQRAIRERTKTHIEALEQRVKDLSSQKPFQDLQAALRRNEAIQAENRELRDGLKRALDAIQPLLAKGASGGFGLLCVSVVCANWGRCFGAGKSCETGSSCSFAAF